MDFSNFFSPESWWYLLFVLVAKVIEVSITTLRIILVSKGYRVKATFLSFFEIMLWVFVASTVLKGLEQEPIRGVVYGIGFSLGIFVGSYVEKLLAFGKVMIQVIVSKEQEKPLSDMIRANHYAVTTLVGKGKDSEKSILMIFANRKGQDLLISKIYSIEPRAMIVTNDVANIQGGYVKSLKNLVK